MYFPEGTHYGNSELPVIATAEANEFGDTIFYNHGTKSRCVVIRGNLCGETVAKSVHERLAQDEAPALLSALKQALRHSREAMPAAERALFDAGTSGPVWMFSARDAIALTE